MKLKSLTAAASLMFASAASQAGVVYEWVEVENNMPVGPISMRIEIADSVVRSGSFHLAVNPGDATIPNTGLVSFSHHITTASPTSWIPGQYGYLYMDLSFVSNNFFMTGSIRMHDWMLRLNTSSSIPGSDDPLLWRIHDTDWGNATPCYKETHGTCEGATGYFRQVPEPASVALLSLGLIGALAARRQKRKQ